MLTLPTPGLSPYHVLIRNPVFADPFEPEAGLIAGRVVAISPSVETLSQGMDLETLEEYGEDTERDTEGMEGELVWNEAAGGYVFERQILHGYSFVEMWVVPPDPNRVVGFLIERCKEKPWMGKEWLEEEGIGSPELSVSYLDRMLAVPPSGDHTGFFGAVIERLDAAVQEEFGK